MQGLAKLLVIDDGAQSRVNLSNILEFVGEDCEAIGSDQLDQVNWSGVWSGCIIGKLSSTETTEEVLTRLRRAHHIPLLLMGKLPDSTDTLPNLIGELELPLNYPQLSEALRHTKDFLGRKGIQMVSNGRKTALFSNLVGQSRGIQEVRHLIEQVAGADANVLILGESGTGKEVVARNIHLHSSYTKGPFVPINCGAIPPDLLESELFGHEKGAFTGALTSRKGRFELAEGGTIFLDEIGDMPIPMQVKLLRVLQERTFERVGGNTTIKVNVRLVAATHRNLEKMIGEGTFREDLYYRLNVFPIEIPSLKERKKDIPLLLQELVSRMELQGSQAIAFSPRAINSLMEHHWSGNVRELANLVERMMILYPNSLVDVNHLPSKYRYGDLPGFQPEETSFTSVEEQERDVFQDIFSNGVSLEESEDEPETETEFSLPQQLPAKGVNLKEVLADCEISMITQALEAQDGVVARAAEMLGIRRTTLVEKMRKYNLQR